jgi:hypothetical protein
MSKTPEHEQSSHKDSIVKILELIDEELTFWEMYLMKKSLVPCEEFRKVDFIFEPITVSIVHRELNINKYPILKNYVNKIKIKPTAINVHSKGWKQSDGPLNIFKNIESDIISLSFLFSFSSHVYSYLSQYIISYFSSISHYYFR